MRLFSRRIVTVAALAGAGVLAPFAHAQTELWSLAEGGDHDAFVEKLNAIDDEARIAEMSDRFVANLAQREVQRAEKIQEAETEFAEHLAEADAGSVVALSEALRSAVELQMLNEDRDAFNVRPDIIALVDKARRAAEDAERNADWIMASELYYRLNVLFDDTHQFKEDAERQATRLGMLRLYVPERFWELRNERRLRDAEEALPPYNPFGDHYTDKLAGIDRLLIQRALNRSARHHVEGVSMREVILGGINAAVTMARTTDLSAAFEGLDNAAAVDTFVGEMEQMRRQLLDGPAPTNNTLSAVLRNLLGVNDATVGIPQEALLHEFGNGAMAELDDFSAIIWPDELRRFQRTTTGSFVGVGIQIQLDEQFNIKVVTPLEGTPAQRAGIQAGDLIKKVNGRSTVGFSIDQAVDVITGPLNTDVTLTIERENEEDDAEQFDVDIVRARIPLQSVKGWRKTGGNDLDWDWFVDPDAGIGYVRLTQFTDSTAADFDRAVAEMKREGLNGLVLDLRYNPGGLLNQAVEICSRFVPRGDVVTTHDANDQLRDHESIIRPDVNSRLYDLPVVVLINQNSASASEIVAGCIQDHADNGGVEGLVVGERSFGKGSVQNVWGLSGNSAMKLTTQYYKLPNGRLIHRKPGASDWGVEPDLTIEMLPSQQVDAWTLRQNADVLPIDREGNIVEDAERPDPGALLTDGLDLQLEAAVVLLRSKNDEALAARESVTPVTN